ncbi:MAG: DNA methyltransferase [Mycobacterium sp.]
MPEPYYQDEQVTLYLGDCLGLTDWLEADVLVTDPPYGRNWRQGRLSGHTSSSDGRAGIANDKDTSVRDAALALWERPAIVFGDLMLPPPQDTVLTAVYQKHPTCGFRGAMGGIRRDAEAIYLLGQWPSGLGGRSAVFTSRRMVAGARGAVAAAGGHPHTKPGDVMEQLIDLCPDGVIADPFAGGGSTLVAARNLGRKAIGVELEEKYCEIAARRLDQMCLDFGGVDA